MHFWDYRHYLLELVKVELTQNYKKSFLGVIWLIILPLMQSLVWIFLEKTHLLNPGILRVNYIAFVIIGTMSWQLYNYSFDQMGNSISSSVRALMQGYIPMILIVISRFSLIFVRFVLSFIVNVIIIYFFLDIKLHVFSFLISIIPLMIFCLSIGMIVSMIEVVSEDLFILGKEFNKILMFLTPIIYSPKVESSFLEYIISMNPLTYFISVPRSFLLGEEQTLIDNYYKYCFITAIFFILSLILYTKKARVVVEKLVE